MTTRQKNQLLRGLPLTQPRLFASEGLRVMQRALRGACALVQHSGGPYPTLVDRFPPAHVTAHTSTGSMGNPLIWERRPRVAVGDRAACEFVWELFKYSPALIAKVRVYRV